jgi:transcription elongation factor GreB
VNYITKQGAYALQRELTHLRTVDRPKIVREVSDAAAQGDRSENAEYIYGKKKLREIDRRMRFLKKRLDDAHLVDPSERKNEAKVFFGATVELVDEHGRQRKVQIVGVDEIDVDAGKISYVSPLGAQLLKKEVGDTFVLRSLNGNVEYEITSVAYL